MKKIIKTVVEKIKKPPNGADLKMLVQMNTRIRALEKVMVGETLEEAVENGRYKGRKREELREMLEASQIIAEKISE